MGCASTCVVCALLMSLPAAWSLVAQVGRLGSCSSRPASRATDPLLQNKNHDESDAKTVERIAGNYYLTGRITAQDQEAWLSINKRKAQREATGTKIVAAFFVGAVMVVAMDPTAAGKVVEAMAQHPPQALCFLIENKLCVVVGAAGVGAFSLCVNATAAEEWCRCTAANLQIWFVGNDDKFPASEVARIAKRLVKTGKITGQEQTFWRGVKDANEIRETARTEAGAAVLCSVIIGKFKMEMSSTTTAAAVVGELTQTHNEALVDFLTAENTLFVVGSVGIVALSTACISFVNQKGEDSEEIKALKIHIDELVKQLTVAEISFVNQKGEDSEEIKALEIHIENIEKQNDQLVEALVAAEDRSATSATVTEPGPKKDEAAAKSKEERIREGQKDRKTA